MATARGSRAAQHRPFRPEGCADYPAVIGCDEVGRGALSGPVVAAAVWFDPCRVPPELLANLDDSKKLTAKRREGLTDLIAAHGRVALAGASARAIDRHGIRAATLTAMGRAVERLGLDMPIRIDGVDVPPDLAGRRAAAVVRGDATVPQIAAASVVAKVFRDRLMARLARRYPGYGWERNAGYGTAEHREALGLHGPSPQHRRSFAPVRQVDWLDAPLA